MITFSLLESLKSDVKDLGCKINFEISNNMLATREQVLLLYEFSSVMNTRTLDLVSMFTDYLSHCSTAPDMKT